MRNIVWRLTVLTKESQERAFDAVLDVAVVGVPDDKWGERPKAFLVLNPGTVADTAELVTHVRGLLAGYKVPRAVELVEELPKTTTGKIQKFPLRERERLAASGSSS